MQVCTRGLRKIAPSAKIKISPQIHRREEARACEGTETVPNRSTECRLNTETCRVFQSPFVKQSVQCFKSESSHCETVFAKV